MDELETLLAILSALIALRAALLRAALRIILLG
jgi:hypothetical protein